MDKFSVVIIGAVVCSGWRPGVLLTILGAQDGRPLQRMTLPKCPRGYGGKLPWNGA